LTSIRHGGPSAIDHSNLYLLKYQPAKFLEGCGLSRWQVLEAKLYNPALTPSEVADLQTQIFMERTNGPIQIGGVFISYSSRDSKFIDKLYEELREQRIHTWLDRHELVAGDLQKQVARAIRLNDVVVLALSKGSVKSDWVEHELKTARQKEKEEGRDVLCPVALDETWKSKQGDLLWDQLFKKHVVDFSNWKQDFKGPFRKLVKGLKIFYEPRVNGGEPNGRA
jgi:hypothetical protein